MDDSKLLWVYSDGSLMAWMRFTSLYNSIGQLSVVGLRAFTLASKLLAGLMAQLEPQCNPFICPGFS